MCNYLWITFAPKYLLFERVFALILSYPLTNLLPVPQANGRRGRLE
jgi:hypothetical protein